MDKIAVEHAKFRFEKAKRSLDALDAATSYEEAESAWTDFLLAASTIYAKLEQGSKGHGKSAPWFGAKKKERRDDPLLRYLHYSRNSDEHGIERVVARGGNARDLIGRPLKFGERHDHMLQKLDGLGGKPVGDPIPGVLHGPSIQMIRVFDRRFNNHCDPPTIHLGKHMEAKDLYPAGIGRLFLKYIQSVIDEAEALQAP